MILHDNSTHKYNIRIDGTWHKQVTEREAIALGIRECELRASRMLPSCPVYFDGEFFSIGSEKYDTDDARRRLRESGLTTLEADNALSSAMLIWDVARQ